MPGSPHSSTGRLAATARASASSCVLSRRSTRVERVAASSSSAAASSVSAVGSAVMRDTVAARYDISRAVFPSRLQQEPQVLQASGGAGQVGPAGAGERDGVHVRAHRDERQDGRGPPPRGRPRRAAGSAPHGRAPPGPARPRAGPAAAFRPALPPPSGPPAGTRAGAASSDAPDHGNMGRRPPPATPSGPGCRRAVPAAPPCPGATAAPSAARPGGRCQPRSAGSANCQAPSRRTGCAPVPGSGAGGVMAAAPGTGPPRRGGAAPPPAASRAAPGPGRRAAPPAAPAAATRRRWHRCRWHRPGHR